MIILAIDTTMNGCSACLYDGASDKLISSKNLEMSRGQAEHLMPMIDEVVKNYNDIDIIAVTKGPGAFTGMRIGLATAKSLGLALDIPVIGVSTFEAVLNTYLAIERRKDYDYYGVLLETKRLDYYFKMFDCDHEGRAMEARDIASIIEGKDCLILGDANNRFKKEVVVEAQFYDINLPDPLQIAHLAMQDMNADCKPVYLRMPEIGTPKNRPRKLK